MNAGEEFGGYTLVRSLGSGGAGTVWLAEDGGGAQVALKLLHPALASSEAARRRLEREAATVNSVRSDSVARVVDIETEASQPFIASEYIAGPTLAAVLKEGPLDVRSVAVLGEDIRHTIQAVHAARVIHRDIKPSNIICSTQGPILIDFGIAMSDEDEHLTRTGLVSGTAGYTAPELLRGQEASEATDWWAWCATMLSASTGRPPFGSGDLQGVTMRVLTGQADLEGIDPLVAQALAQGLSPDPSVRFAPGQIIDAFNSAADFAYEVDLDTVDWPTAYAAKSEPTCVLPSDDAPGRTRTMPAQGATPLQGSAHEQSQAEAWEAGQSSDSPGGQGFSQADALPADATNGQWGPTNGQWGPIPGAQGTWDPALGGHPQDWAQGVPGHFGGAFAPVPGQNAGGAVVAPGQVTGGAVAMLGHLGEGAPVAGQLSGGVPTAPRGASTTPRQGTGWAPVAPEHLPGWGESPIGQPRTWDLEASESGFPTDMRANHPEDEDEEEPTWLHADEPGYIPALPKTTWLLGPALLMPLALLPILLGTTGSLALALVLFLLSFTGANLRRREMRRIRNGGMKSSDTAAMIAASPLMFLRVLAELAFGFTLAALIPYLSWVAYSSSTMGNPNWGLWPKLMSYPGIPISAEPLIQDPHGAASLWAALWATLVLTWLMPTSIDLRDGTSRFSKAVFGPLWVRFIAGMISAGVVITTWYLLTGGLS